MEALKSNYKRIFSLKLAKKILFSLIFILLFDFYLFPLPTLANSVGNEINSSEAKTVDITKNNKGKILDSVFEANTNSNLAILPQNNNLKVKFVKKVVITAYNSEVGQCDSSPCITANGFNVCEHGKEDTIAANFLSFGTKVRIPELFGDRVFVVRDRMNKRYQNRIDVWMVEKADAKKFGLKISNIEILE